MGVRDVYVSSPSILTGTRIVFRWSSAAWRSFLYHWLPDNAFGNSVLSFTLHIIISDLLHVGEIQFLHRFSYFGKAYGNWQHGRIYRHPAFSPTGISYPDRYILGSKLSCETRWPVSVIYASKISGNASKRYGYLRRSSPDTSKFFFILFESSCFPAFFPCDILTR